MKIFLPAILFLLSLSSFSQTVVITGRFYFDANRNHVYDPAENVLSGQRVYAIDTTSALVSTNTDQSGIYSFTVPPGVYAIGSYDDISDIDYINISNLLTPYYASGSHTFDIAYQLKDSLTSISANISGSNGYSSIPGTGGTYSYKLDYGYDGSLHSLPSTVTLNFNPMLKLVSASKPPTASSNGKLEWKFPNILRNDPTVNTISLSFNFPAVGDTVRAYILSPQIKPDIAVTLPDYPYIADYYQQVEFPATPLVGSTSGVKWLRHFEPRGNVDNYDECTTVDTTQNGENYFIGGVRSRASGLSTHGSPAFIAKLNKDGLSVWEKYLDSLPGVYFGWVTAVKHTPDGGCIVLGAGNSPDSISNYEDDIVVARFDSSGNMAWGKLLHGSQYDETGNDFAVLPDGSILIAGDTYSRDGDFQNNRKDNGYSNLFITKLSPAGNILFTKIYGGSKDEYGYGIRQLQNGSFLVNAGTTSNDGDVAGAHQHNDYSEEAWILNVDGSGNIIWNKCYGGTKDSYLTGAADNNGGILLTGYTDSKNGDLPYYPEIGISLWALQISTTGNIQWSKLYKIYEGYKDSNYLANTEMLYSNSAYTALQKTKDGGFVVGGTFVDKYGPIKARHGKDDFAIIKLNNTGDLVWQKAVGGSGYEYLNNIQVDKNDDIIFVGNSPSDNDDLYEHSKNYRQLMVVGKLGVTNTISGQVFVDNNGNHIKDAGEHSYSQGRISSAKVADSIEGRIFNGRYLNNVDTGNYVSTYKPANNYYTVFPASHNTSFAGLDLKDSLDFALSPKPNIKDLEVQLTDLSIARPGFWLNYRIITKNAGTASINNVVVGLKKDSRQTYESSSRPYSGSQTDSIWWGPFTLNAFDIDTVYITLKSAIPPALVNGDTLALRATANPVVNDSSVANNVFELKELVRGSYDPNDKAEAHAGTLTTTQYANGESLQYQIRFQNTGTDTAFFITVKDTLQAGVNLASLEVVSASHPYTFRMNGNVATWDFKNIKLPDSTTNEAGSHGFISFKIKPSAGLNVGDEFTNRAAIYFDYNLPVLTNQDKTVIGSRKGICAGGNASFIAGIAGSSYQWQINTGSSYTNLTNTGIYSGVNTATLVIATPATSMSGYRYRCLVNGNTYSPENKLKFTASWKGSTGTAWENIANWDCGILPDAQTEVIVPVGTVYPLVSSNASCYSLRLSPGSTVTVKTGFKLNITGKSN